MNIGVATIADIQSIERKALRKRDLPQSTYEALLRGESINPNKIALRFFLQGEAYADQVFFTYKDIIGLVNQAANMFHDLGIGENDVVSMILPNLPQAFFTIWGAEAAGIVNPINPMLEPAVMAEIMNAAKTKVLVTLGPFPSTDIWEKVASIVDQVDSLETILQVDLANYLSTIQRLAVRFIRFRAGKGPHVRARVLDFGGTAYRYPAESLVSGREIKGSDIASYFHTGGTTGTPKLARHTHFNEIYDAWAAAQFIDMTPEKVLFCGLPLFHVNGVIVTGMLPLMHGASLVLGTPQGYRGGVIPNFWSIVEQYKINFFSGVPTVYSALLNVPLEEQDISSLEFAVCGAAPMPVEVFKQFEEKTKVRILEGYGLTEGTCISSINPPLGERRIGSIGYRLPFQEMKVVHLDENDAFERDCAVDEIGTIVIRGPNVFSGYTEEAHNRHVWLESADGQGPWLNTGDLGRQDADGYFWLTGRKKELIIRGGHNIDPKLIEDPLIEHPDVALAAAVGRPDAHAGELPVAYVQLQPEASATEETLLAYAQENIGERAAVPKAIHIVDEVPQTAVGKIFKPFLIQLEVEDVYREVAAAVEGVANVEVSVKPHKLYGIAADVQVTAEPGVDTAALEEALNRALGQYAVHYQLTVDSNQ
ncbi:MAG: acyl-CoA synthetase [Candidatus Promineifilaceae bacterium]|jgi:fatty-acyl-CoA synthase